MRTSPSLRPFKLPGLLGLTLWCSLGSGITQTPAVDTEPFAPRFEVASIRPSESGGFAHFVNLEFQQDGYRAKNATLQLLLKDAYGVDARQIIGAPAWIESQDFDIEARIDVVTAETLQHLNSEELKAAQKHMLQSLLAERFALTLHRDTKELPIYSLVIAKHGMRLKPAQAGNTYAERERWPGGDPMGPHFVTFARYGGKVQMKGQGASVNQLIDRLTEKFADRLGRKIVDNTGLTGNYDFELHFTVPWSNNASENGLLQAETSSQASDDDKAASSEQSLFTALPEQLGLKLESKRGPVETIVIDHVERPSDN